MKLKTISFTSLFLLLTIVSVLYFSPKPVAAIGGPCTVSDVGPDEVAVQNAVNAASNGDVICLAPGTVTYNVGVNLGYTKGVEIRGYGNMPSPWGSAGQTVIHLGATGTAFAGWDPPTGGANVISNIKFIVDATSTGVPLTSFATITWNLTSGNGGLWIIHHNDFEDHRCDITRDITTGSNRGLIYANRFVTHSTDSTTLGCAKLLHDGGATNMMAVVNFVNDDDSFFNSPDDWGSADTNGLNHLYVETNYIEGKNNDQNRSRTVWRFNEMHSSTKTDHGYDSGYGDRMWELYNNHWFCDKAFVMSGYIGLRGGTGRVFNNTFDDTHGGACSPVNPAIGTFILAQFKLQECYRGIAGWPGSYPGTYPVARQVGWGWIAGQNINVGDSTHQRQPGVSGYPQALDPIYVFNNIDNNGGGLPSVRGIYNGECRAMTMSNTSKGSTTSNIQVGSYINEGQDAVVIYSDLIDGSEPAISDDHGNDWTEIQGGTNGSLRLRGWHSKITHGDEWITVTVSSKSSAAARSVDLIAVRGLESVAIDKNPAVISDNTQPYITPASGALSQTNELVIGYYAMNGPVQLDNFSYNNDSYSFSLPDQLGSTAVIYAGMNYSGINGTSGGAATDNVTTAILWQNVENGASASSTLSSGANRNALAGTITLKTIDNASAGLQSPLDLQTEDFIKQDREYYAQNNSFNGTSGTGSGPRSSRPTTCTTGVAYWSTDQGSWNTSGAGGQGVLDKCTATNSWTNAWYVPYPYPHPLAGGTGTPSPVTPTPPPAPDTTAPSISSISASSLTTTTATITWTTNEQATTQVDYGLAALSYGSQSSLNSSLTTSHSQSLSSLTPNTIYHYRVRSTDASGNTTNSPDNIFSTSATPPTPNPSTPTPTPTPPTPTPPTPSPTPSPSPAGGSPSPSPVTPPQQTPLVFPQPTPTPTPSAVSPSSSLPTTTTGMTTAQLQALLTQLLKQVADLQAQLQAKQTAQKGTTTSPTLTTTRTLYLGVKGTDVTTLQIILTNKGYLQPNNTSGYFGPLTQSAVRRFQCATLSLCSGSETTSGWGVVGRKSREVLNK